MAGWISALIAFLAVAGQLVNIFLNLKLRNAGLESEKRVLAIVAHTYKLKDVCTAEMAAPARTTWSG